MKERLLYDIHRRRELTPEGRAFLEYVVAKAYGATVPPVGPVLTTAHRRATLDVQCGSQTTIDVDLAWSGGGRAHRADHLALLESKNLSGRGAVDALLGSLAVRPVSLSKYCLGVALLHLDTAANPWSRLRDASSGGNEPAPPPCPRRPPPSRPARFAPTWPGGERSPKSKARLVLTEAARATEQRSHEHRGPTVCYSWNSDGRMPTAESVSAGQEVGRWDSNLEPTDWEPHNGRATG